MLVLEADEEEVRLGGAASVAMLARGLGAQVSVAGVLGDDASGRVLQKLLGELGVEHDDIVVGGGPIHHDERARRRPRCDETPASNRAHRSRASCAALPGGGEKALLGCTRSPWRRRRRADF